MKTHQRSLYSCWSSQVLSTAAMTPLFISALLAALSLGSRAQTDSVLQPEADVAAPEGEAVTLGCLYNSSSSNHYLFWYKQVGNNSPEFILSRFKVGSGKTEDEERFSSTLDSTLRSVPLKIQKLHVTDSAVYYCALLNTGTKIIFGTGTRLTIETNTENEPSFYKLTDGNESLCLAADFSKSKAAKEKKPLFDKTAAAQINNISLYNQVVWLSDSDKCEEGGPGPEECGTLEPDPKVNMVSLTILGLRLLFLKTIVFNVLMTLRLWISQ